MRAIILVVFGFLLRLAASCLLTGHSVHLRGRNASSNPVGKRWVRMPSDRDDDEDPNAPGAIPWGRVWKDNTIIWCFGTTERWYSIATVRHDITAAWKLWVLEGVDEQVMIFREGTDAECYDETFDQSKLLDVWPGSLASTVGQRKGVAGQMYLSETGDNGLGDRIASFAHEIGHAWGMLHEHQRPNKWGLRYGGLGNTDTFQFNCRNLDSFADCTEGLDDDDIDSICNSYTKARKGVELPDGNPSTCLHSEEWLPLPRIEWFTAGADGAAGFDEDSLMLYPSRLGGKLGTGGQKMVVYTKADGSEFKTNTVPSPGDVEGLKGLYPRAKPADRPCLLTDDCNSQQAAFRASQGGGSCSS